MDTNIKYLSVAALNRYLFYKFDTDLNLRNVYLKAEVSNVRFSKGILYFVLKDSESEISALMYGSLLEKLNFQIEDGMTVLVYGRVGLYTKRGTYAITVLNIESVGLGDAYLNFIRLKEKLLKEGLFDDQYKKPIPKFCHKIGLVTSGTGDAMHDVISTVAKRYPLAEVILYPALVQGADAPKSIINAIIKANGDAICDCLIIARGGGSLEDLSCFNDEELARCIFESSIPTISGIGHEADFTICDFVSDRRAPTPTGAAVIASPDMNDLIREINTNTSKLATLMKNKFMNCYNEYKLLANSYVLNNFESNIDHKIDLINSYKARLDNLSPSEKINHYLNDINNYKANIINSIDKIYISNENRFNSYVNKLILLNPLNIMSKGYTVSFQNKHVISKIDEVKIDEPLETKILGGTIISEIKEINKE